MHEGFLQILFDFKPRKCVDESELRKGRRIRRNTISDQQLFVQPREYLDVVLRLISYAWFLHPYLLNSLMLAQELTLIHMLCFEGLGNETKMGCCGTCPRSLDKVGRCDGMLKRECTFPFRRGAPHMGGSQP